MTSIRRKTTAPDLPRRPTKRAPTTHAQNQESKSPSETSSQIERRKQTVLQVDLDVVVDMDDYRHILVSIRTILSSSEQ